MYKFSSLFGRLLGFYLVIVIGTLGLLGILLSQLLKDYFFTAKQAELVSRGQEIAELSQTFFTKDRSQTEMQELLEVASRFFVGRAVVINRDGEVMALVGRQPWRHLDGGKPPIVTQQLPEIMPVFDGQVMTRVGFSPLFGESVFLAAVPITVEGKVVGAVVTHSRVFGLKDTIGHMRWLVFGLALAAMLLSTVLGYVLARSVADPLKHMSRIAGQMAAGNFASRVPEYATDEVGRLAAAFNRLSSSLRLTIQSLTEEQEKLRHIMATMAEGMIAVNREGRILMVNSPAERMLGIAQAELLGYPISERHDHLAEAFARAMGTGDEETIEWDSLGDTVTVQAHLAPTAVEGSMVGAVAVLHDVTEINKVERMRRQFVADASHQLRSPLTTMQGYAEALLDGIVSDDETRQRYLALMVYDAKRLSRLIAQLQDLSYLESGQAKIDIRAFSLSDVLSRTVAALPLGDDQPRVSVDVPDDLPPAYADELYTEQALRNLLENAIRHTPSNGHVTVWARLETDHFVFGVTDTGSGIAPEHLPRIWERFYRVDDDRTEGTGLGLAIVKNLVERQGGQVTAQSQPGHGSIFTVTLPRAAHAEHP